MSVFVCTTNSTIESFATVYWLRESVCSSSLTSAKTHGITSPLSKTISNSVPISVE